MKTRFFTGGILALFLFVGMLVGLGLGPQIAEAAPGAASFPNVVSSSIVRFTTFLQPTEVTRIVVTDGSTITPLSSYTTISSTAATGTSSIASPAATVNNLLILHNIGAQTITITDTGTIHATGNIVLTADDSTILIWDGAAWNQIAAESAN